MGNVWSRVRGIMAAENMAKDLDKGFSINNPCRFLTTSYRDNARLMLLVIIALCLVYPYYWSHHPISGIQALMAFNRPLMSIGIAHHIVFGNIRLTRES